jgi:hypothetical protein
MLDSPILQVVIGLFLVFFVFSTLCSGLAELINRWLRLRADYLLQGIRKLLDGAGKEQRQELQPIGRPGAAAQPETNGQEGQPLSPPGTAALPPPPVQLLAEPGELADLVLKQSIVGTLGQQDDGDPVIKKYMPSYLPSRTFAAGLMGLLVPDASGDTTMPEVVGQIERLPEPARSSLLALAKTAEGNVTAFRLRVERWYDDQMDRVSGWYKRHIRRFVILFAIIFAVAFNVNTIALARTLYTDPAARAALVAQADIITNCPEGQEQQCQEQASNAVIELGKSTLPLFWQPTSTECALNDADTDAGNDCNWFEARELVGWGIAIAIIGWAIAAGAFAMGGPFWFDLLNRLASLRGSGQPPPKAPDPGTQPS